MTTLSNLDVLAQLGWTMKLMHDSTGGRLPRYWRPPYGDNDNRVVAIAWEVFGLRAIHWNQDTGDWSLTSPGGTTLQAINNSFSKWLAGPKSPGLIVLEHELFNQSAQAFINAYPDIIANGWKMMSVAQLIGNGTVYENSQNALSPVTAATGVLPGDIMSSTTTVTPTSTVSSSHSATATHTSWGTTASSIHLSWVASALICVITLTDFTPLVYFYD